MLKARQRYSISEAASMLGVSVGWMRLGEKTGALPCARRNAVGWRYYTHQDLERLRKLGVGERKRQLESAR